jgi:plasmid maintenance system antidote protein VapI
MAQNPITPVLYWRAKHGPDSIVRLSEFLNRGLSQAEIAERFEVSRSRICVFVDNTYDVHWTVKPYIQEALDVEELARRSAYDQSHREHDRIRRVGPIIIPSASGVR